MHPDGEIDHCASPPEPAELRVRQRKPGCLLIHVSRFSLIVSTGYAEEGNCRTGSDITTLASETPTAQRVESWSVVSGSRPGCVTGRCRQWTLRPDRPAAGTDLFPTPPHVWSRSAPSPLAAARCGHPGN